MIRSLRVRLILAGGTLSVLFMLGLLPFLQSAFGLALRDAIEQRLASDATTLISAAHVDGNQLSMPQLLPDEEFDLPDSRLLGFIYDRNSNLVWQSRATHDSDIHYTPRYDGKGTVFTHIHEVNGVEYFVYDVEVKLLAGKDAAYSFVAVQPVEAYKRTIHALRERLLLGFGAALLVLMLLLWGGLTWGFRALRQLSVELDAIESGARDSLSEEHPRELLRLTGSLNRLLRSEREHRQRYRDSLGDLAHSLKTPLAVLQGVSEVIAQRPQDVEQARVLQAQIERMSQQISYQLQRASLRKSGLIRDREALQPVVDSLVSTLDKVYRDKRVRVSVQIGSEGQVPMERNALLEMLGNLMENAYRLCLSEVRVSLQNTAQGLELWIEDDGPGVPLDQRARILERGERLDRQNPGQGIGLAVVKDIIESYDAQLRLEDSNLGGAMFRVRFKAV